MPNANTVIQGQCFLIWTSTPRLCIVHLYTDFVGEDKGEEWKGCCNEILNNQKSFGSFLIPWKISALPGKFKKTDL